MRKTEARFGITLERMNVTGGWYQRTPTLPLRPLWGGLAMDTFFHGGALGALYLLWHCARRALRTARGRCVACGYRLNDPATGCPECGRGREDFNNI